MHAACPVCKYENPVGNLFCGTCRSPLKPEAEDDVVEARNTVLMEAVRDQVAATLTEFLQARHPP